jgi:hypothetical protein
MIIVGDTSVFPPTKRGIQALEVVLQLPGCPQAICSEMMDMHSLAQELCGYRVACFVLSIAIKELNYLNVNQTRQLPGRDIAPQ